MSFQAKLASKHVYLVNSLAQGGVAQWHYLQVTPFKEPLFLKAVEQMHCDLSAFGEVLVSGYGEMPPAHVQWEYAQQ
jgi:hypothetical protein